MQTKGKLLVLVGPTAVGKTNLSLHLAEKFNGEILSGDSMQVYRGMDVGTAKASQKEQQQVRHHLLDLVNPDESFSVEEFQKHAYEAIAAIHARSHLPMLVGGTGLYIQAVTHGYRLPNIEEDVALRAKWNDFAEKEGNEALWRKLQEQDEVTAMRLHPNDRRRVIRALEVIANTGKPFSAQQVQQKPPYDILFLGLTMPRELLYKRINERVDHMIAAGLLQEVRALYAQGYGRELTSMQALGYKEIMQHLAGEISLDEAIERIKRGTRKFAKRQLSWFRRMDEIHWFDCTASDFQQEITSLIAGDFLAHRE
ncbi:tRNA (adenosine(37)-N6)-dimethylallyltransferase MiaA [Mechercharimyces sp. CAU 1602]|uniref:tRNA (adenosine(37)-N6)-dimethylallyltransferase MiaA n=1 Tax=Mechercharimyces sp. CAU 1602 TaxID=2973933 RepID=UPI0021619F65|nr:tRNA (adenosine(37)-N6)-dimethylallyltransferase MiaA [Mechercharimyces sp. CAU 1602]MCS1351207.1 tRNA (adenosine(37)-N6)-dimethylallyltransferase MiaA [Mechercharimyces sp. CAU 1602]